MSAPSHGTAVLLTWTLLAAACIAGDERPTGGPSTAPSRSDGCPIPVEVARRIRAGYDPDRSGDVQFVPAEPNFLYGARLAGRLSHSGPWDYLQRVPLLVHGPGRVRPRGRVEAPATLADVAPTLAAHLGTTFEALDGRVLRPAAPAESDDPPRLVLVVVWDGVGRNVLDAWPDAWPVLRGLTDEGVWFARAEVGSSPSITPVTHTTLGTGALPRSHGIVDMQFRVGGRLVPSNARGPEYLRTPTLADVHDVATGNRALVGVVASHEWHLSMLGHGAALPGADRDLAVLQDDATVRWTLFGDNAPLFRFPRYLRRFGGLAAAVAELDRADGELDGRWLGEEVLRRPEDLVFTPAVVTWQTRVLEEMIRREGFGADEVPDLLFTNYKVTDRVGHRWSMDAPQMREALAAQDAALGELVALIDDAAGAGEWLLVVTADHGSTPLPQTTGAFAIDGGELRADLETRFRAPGDDRRLVLGLRPTQLWLDHDVLSDAGATVEDVAAFAAAYTKGDAAADPSTLAPEEVDDRVFAAAFPGDQLSRADCPG